MLIKHFENPHFILGCRNPYAYAVSKYNACRQKTPYSKIAEQWVKATQLKISFASSTDRSVFDTTYEELCDDTENFKSRLIEWMPELHDIDFSGQTRHTRHVDTKSHYLRNMNAEKIRLLTKENIVELNSVLQNHEELITRYGYEFL
jgi:hypothetical protein